MPPGITATLKRPSSAPGSRVCGHCGYASRSRTDAVRAPVVARYRCVERTKHVHGCPQPSIAANLVDGPVWERVASVLRDPAMIAREVARHRDDGGLDRDLAAIEKQIASIADKQGRTRTGARRRR